MSSPQVSTPHQGRRILFGGLPFVLLSIGIMLWLVANIHPLLSLAPAIGLSTVSHVAYFVVSYRVYTAPMPRVGGKPTAKPSEARELIARLESSLSQEAAQFYSQLIIDPRGTRSESPTESLPPRARTTSLEA